MFKKGAKNSAAAAMACSVFFGVVFGTTALAHNDQSNWNANGPVKLESGVPSVNDFTVPLIQLYHQTYSDSVQWYYTGFDWGFIKDDPGSSKTVVSFNYSAPANSLRVDGDGRVGHGVFNPESPLHVVGTNGPTAGSAGAIFEDNGGARAPRTMLMLKNNGNTKFEIMDTGTGNSWAFTNNGSEFRMSYQDSGTVEFKVTNSGNAHLAGSLFQNSDINAKQRIVPVDVNTVLDKVNALPITQWEYKDTPEQRHIGPMAQDFYSAFGLGAGETSIASIDTAGVALASIQALSAQNQALQHQNLTLEQRVRELEQQVNRLQELEVIVMKLAADQAETTLVSQ